MRLKIKFLLIVFAALFSSACILIGSPRATETAIPPTREPTMTPTLTERPTATVTPTASVEEPAADSSCPPETLPIEGWPVYCNERFGFYFQYPPEATLTETGFNSAHIDLPVEPDTNLGEKYMDLIVQESSSACSSPLAEGYPPEMVTRQNLVIQGINYLKQSGSDAGAGNYYDWIAYSTGRSDLCVYFDFVLHSTNRFNYPTPPPEFDFNAETADFEKIVGSLHWYTP
jgi:hypothetical protein